MSVDTGIIVLGSQRERHGLLPEDTDTKIAACIAFKAAAALTGAKIVGLVNSATEHDYLNHGTHHMVSTVLEDLSVILKNSVERLGITRFIIVNGHGGNKLLIPHISKLESTLDVKIFFNNSIIDLEGAHAASGECSIAVAAGICSKESLVGQDDFKQYPEVGFIGLKKAHVNESIKKLAEQTKIEGIKIDVKLGKKLLKKAVNSVVHDIQN